MTFHVIYINIRKEKTAAKKLDVALLFVQRHCGLYSIKKDGIAETSSSRTAIMRHDAALTVEHDST
jgi:hypothetical protein